MCQLETIDSRDKDNLFKKIVEGPMNIEVRCLDLNGRLISEKRYNECENTEGCLSSSFRDGKR